MSLMLSIYTSQEFREYALPKIDNRDYTVQIPSLHEYKTSKYIPRTVEFRAFESQNTESRYTGSGSVVVKNTESSSVSFKAADPGGLEHGTVESKNVELTPIRYKSSKSRNVAYKSVDFKNNDFEKVDLQLEVLRGVWRLRPTDSYVIHWKGRLISEPLELKVGQILELSLPGENTVTIQISERSRLVRPFRRISLESLTELKVGRKELCELAYPEERTLSAVHAVLYLEKDAWYLECLSTNGVYVNGTIVTSQVKLTFGDEIRLAGLFLLFLETELAVDVWDGKVRIADTCPEAPQAVPEELLPLPGEKSPVFQPYHRSPRRLEQISPEPIEIEGPPKAMPREPRSWLAAVGPSLTMALPMIVGTLLLRSASAYGRSGAYLYYGLVMTGGSSLLSVFWTLTAHRRESRKEMRRLDARKNEYLDYLALRNAELQERAYQYRRIRKKQYPGPGAQMRAAEAGTLWERNITHPDFSSYRLGLGDEPFPVEIRIPREKFALGMDALMQRPKQMQADYAKIASIPILCDLRTETLWGITGGPGMQGSHLPAMLLLLQIAACNCYTDARIALLYEGEREQSQRDWEFVRWLPHVWSDDRKMRYVGGTPEERAEVLYALTEILRHRAELESGSRESRCFPHYYLVVERGEWMEHEMIGRYLEQETSLGITTLILAEHTEDLPNACRRIVENSLDFQGMYGTDDWKEDRQSIHFDSMTADEAEVFARSLSGIQVAKRRGQGSIPESVDFLTLFQVRRVEELGVEERWLKNRTDHSIRGELGQKAGGEVLALNLHEKYHGPHGLLAGTTGSGKSETLQTLILSLSINYSPEELGFFLIDYKGGGMANLFQGLPHLIGSISNLSEGQIRRSMVSIKSENRRRQRLFGEAGVNHIDGYVRLYRSGEVTEPIPHLLIVIDEFAELKKEEPEFLKELVSVAQVGRSLGVHLILATQKPSGVVDESIRSNSRFRIGLRVQDRQDSVDLLGKPDAAFLTATGRGYLQVGNDEVYEEFQSGYSGAAYNPEAANERHAAIWVTNTGRRESVRSGSGQSSASKCTQLIAVREHLKQTALTAHLRPVHRLWLPELPTKLILEDLLCKSSEECSIQAISHQAISNQTISSQAISNQAISNQAISTQTFHNQSLQTQTFHNQSLQTQSPLTQTSSKNNPPENNTLETSATLGLIDDPEHQEQRLAKVCFPESGHLLLLGTVGSGKSTLLQTLLYGLLNQYGPDQLQVLAFDYSSGALKDFSEAPQVIAILDKEEELLQQRAFCQIQELLETRRKRFAGGSYAQYVRRSGQTCPVILVMVDNYPGFREKTGDRYEGEILKIAREGVSLGVWLVLTGNGISLNEIPSRLTGFFSTTWCLALPDKFAYGDALHTMAIEALPEPGVRGRGLLMDDSRVLEFQTALAIEAADDYERATEIQRACQEFRERWSDAETLKIPSIPEPFIWEDFLTTQQTSPEWNEGLKIPIGCEYESARTVWLSLEHTYTFLVAGERRSGRKNVLRLLLSAVQKKGGKICILETEQSRIPLPDETDVPHLVGEEAMVAWFREVLTPLFQERNQIRRRALEEGFSEEETARLLLKEPPLLIGITDLVSFLHVVYHSEQGMKGFLENILDRGAMHGIYFAAVMESDERAEVSGYPAWRLFARDKTGIHLGGQLQKNPILSFEDLSYPEQAKSQKPGIAYLPSMDGENRSRKVVIPWVETARKERL